MKFAYNKRTNEIDAISDKIADKLKSEGKPVFNSEADAIDYATKIQSRRSPEQIAAEGEQANVEMNKQIAEERKAAYPPLLRGIGETLAPATYEKMYKGEEPGFKESSLDIARAGLFALPGGSQARGLLPIAETSAKTLLPKLGTKALNIGRTVLPTLGIEAGRGTAVEGVESITEDRPFSWEEAKMNMALGSAGELAGIGAQEGLKSGLKSANKGFGIDKASQQLIESKNLATPGALKSAISNQYTDLFGSSVQLTDDLKPMLKNNLANAVSLSIDNNRTLPNKVKAEMKLGINDAIDELFESRKSLSTESLTAGTGFKFSNPEIGKLIERNLPKAILLTQTGERGLNTGIQRAAAIADATSLPKISIPIPHTALMKNTPSSSLKPWQVGLRFGEVYNLPTDEKPGLLPLQ